MFQRVEGFFGLFDTESKASEAAEAKAAPTRAQMMEDSGSDWDLGLDWPKNSFAIALLSLVLLLILMHTTKR